MAMKSYVTDKQMRLVGKGWEVRASLRRMCDRAGGGQVRMAELLPQLIGPAERGSTRSRQRRTPRQKTADRRVIPFPLS